MFPSRTLTYAVLIVVGLCCSLVLVEAQNYITNPTEVKALGAIRASLIDPNKNLSNWDRGDPCTSNWVGVLCYNMTLEDGYLHVQRLQLLRRNLTGTLSPELGNLLNLTILDFMWNNIGGSIPKEIGNIKTLVLLLLSGNKLTGPLPEELGYLPNLDRLQIDENNISGPLPISFSNLNKAKHFHMNNNSISGQIPHELSRLPSLIHLLLDNNKLSGHLPPELSELPNLKIFQLDNNDFGGTLIPTSYGNISQLLKLSLRNCKLQGPIPSLSQIPKLYYIDLSFNQLNGSIPQDGLSQNITTIYLSNNNLTGTIPTYFSELPRLQKLSIANNNLSGSVPSSIWQNKTLNATESLDVDLRNNGLSNVSGNVDLPQNVSLWLQGNPLCSNNNLVQFCGFGSNNGDSSPEAPSATSNCSMCQPPSEYNPTIPDACFCAAPLIVGYRLKSPGFSDFPPYKIDFVRHLTSGLEISFYQLHIESFAWEEGPRLGMQLKIFPPYVANNEESHFFNRTEIQRIMNVLISWDIPDNDLFGPYEPLSLSYNYNDVTQASSSSLSKGALVGIVLGTIAVAVTLSVVVSIIIQRIHTRKYHTVSRRHHSSKALMRLDAVKAFTFGEMALATNNFDDTVQIGQGGYGKVYKGILADSTIVAIKRAEEGSLQGEKEFLTEIELLSRLHHRNLLSLIGYCDEESEQMLVYEFMPNGTLRDNLIAKSRRPLSFDMRLRIALGSAKGILYLHTEANPPIFHRDIKASNILLDSTFTAKVADFGLSRLAPVAIEGNVPAHVSTVVKGTPGYLDPEYFLTYQLTDKSDVYSLGIVFLELLTALQPISHGKNIVREVNVAYESGIIFSIIDGRMGSYPADPVVKFLSLALKCCQNETDARPSMAEVVRELENILVMMPESEIRIVDTMIMGVGKVVTPPSSSSNAKNPFMSMDLSGSNLDSGDIPTVAPR